MDVHEEALESLARRITNLLPAAMADDEFASTASPAADPTEGEEDELIGIVGPAMAALSCLGLHAELLLRLADPTTDPEDETERFHGELELYLPERDGFDPPSLAANVWLITRIVQDRLWLVGLELIRRRAAP